MATPEDTDLWVFGYGSLMWRTGFEFLERRQARLIGAHRALCVYSHVHRGTPAQPGLVLGLDRGGSCRGVAFRVAAKDAHATLAYLQERELVTKVYKEAVRPVDLLAHDHENREPAFATVRADGDNSAGDAGSKESRLPRAAQSARVLALCFLVDRSHPQYAGTLPLEKQLHLVRHAHGRSGANPDYVVETVRHMRELGIRDPDLEWLAARL